MAVHRISKSVVGARGFQAVNGASYIDYDGFPKSGTAGAYAGQDACNPGTRLVDINTGVVFVNEGTKASPYWTPETFHQANLMAWYTDFRDGAGKALADTAATATLTGSGIRVCGQGVAETDSGLVVSMSDQGALGRITTTDEDEHTVVLTVGTGTTPVYQPDQNELMVVDAEIAHVSAITLRALFFGFGGDVSDALDPLINGAATTISFGAQADDIAGLCMDVGLTDADGLFAVYDKGNANASIATTATGVDIGVTVAAAGTFQRLRVEVDADGGVRMFVNKVLKATFAAGTLDVDEEISPILQLISESAAVKSLDVRSFGSWAKRVRV